MINGVDSAQKIVLKESSEIALSRSSAYLWNSLTLLFTSFTHDSVAAENPLNLFAICITSPRNFTFSESHGYPCTHSKSRNSSSQFLKIVFKLSTAWREKKDGDTGAIQ